MIKTIAKKPIQERCVYIKYENKLLKDGNYQLDITYCMYNGNIIDNIKAIRKKTEIVSPDKIRGKEETLLNSINKTRSMLAAEARRNGATSANVEAILRQYMR